MRSEKLRSVLTAVLAFFAAAWILHTLSKNFVGDPDFKKFLSEKTTVVEGAAWF